MNYILVVCLIWIIVIYFLYLVGKRTLRKLERENEELHNLLVIRTQTIKEKNNIIKELKEEKCQNAIPPKKKGKK